MVHTAQVCRYNRQGMYLKKKTLTSHRANAIMKYCEQKIKNRPSSGQTHKHKGIFWKSFFRLMVQRNSLLNDATRICSNDFDKISTNSSLDARKTADNIH